jgi:hypothetical protein
MLSVPHAESWFIVPAPPAQRKTNVRVPLGPPAAGQFSCSHINQSLNLININLHLPIFPNKVTGKKAHPQILYARDTSLTCLARTQNCSLVLSHKLLIPCYGRRDTDVSKSKSMGITLAGTSAVRVSANMVTQVRDVEDVAWRTLVVGGVQSKRETRIQTNHPH